MSLAPRGKILPSCSPRPEEAILSELARLNLESWANFEGRIKQCGSLKRLTSLGPSLTPRRTTLTLIKHRIISAIIMCICLRYSGNRAADFFESASGASPSCPPASFCCPSLLQLWPQVPQLSRLTVQALAMTKQKFKQLQRKSRRRRRTTSTLSHTITSCLSSFL